MRALEREREANWPKCTSQPPGWTEPRFPHNIQTEMLQSQGVDLKFTFLLLNPLHLCLLTTHCLVTLY